MLLSFMWCQTGSCNGQKDNKVKRKKKVVKEEKTKKRELKERWTIRGSGSKRMRQMRTERRAGIVRE